jgi:hypothetical protein
MPKGDQQSALELTKQGNPKAIAALMNRQLQQKGITAKASVKKGCLQIMLESEQVPNQKALVAAIRKFMTSLGIETIQKVKVYGRQAGEKFPAWDEEFELTALIQSQPSSNTSELPQQAPLSNQVITETAPSKADSDSLLREKAKWGDSESITILLNAALENEGVTVRANLQLERQLYVLMGL